MRQPNKLYRNSWLYDINFFEGGLSETPRSFWQVHTAQPDPGCAVCTGISTVRVTSSYKSCDNPWIRISRPFSSTAFKAVEEKYLSCEYSEFLWMSLVYSEYLSLYSDSLRVVFWISDRVIFWIIHLSNTGYTSEITFLYMLTCNVFVYYRPNLSNENRNVSQQRCQVLIEHIAC